MKRCLPLILFVLCFAGPVHAEEEECTLQFEALKPVMRPDAKNHTINLVKEQRQLYETAMLEDGTTVSYSVGGCVHYSFTYRFENIPGGVPKEPEDPFALPLALLDATPLRDDAERILQDRMREKQKTGFAAFDETNTTDLPCGDALCTLTLEPDAVVMVYDFAI
jgi:hypothetical protein